MFKYERLQVNRHPHYNKCERKKDKKQVKKGRKVQHLPDSCLHTAVEQRESRIIG